jgi:translation initiation factor IF-3
MLPQSDDYRYRLINMILFASSQEQVKTIIDDMTREMEEKKVNKHIVARQLGKVISDLDSFNPVEKQAQQWNNIKLARILLRRKWTQLHSPIE